VSTFRDVVDDLTGGCGCVCHTGTGYNTTCAHCWNKHGTANIIDPGPIGTVRANQRVTLDGEPPRYRCHCPFTTNSRFRWWLHRVRSWPFK
jgi:hypothetical protein